MIAGQSSVAFRECASAYVTSPNPRCFAKFKDGRLQQEPPFEIEGMALLHGLPFLQGDRDALREHFLVIHSPTFFLACACT